MLFCHESSKNTKSGIVAMENSVVIKTVLEASFSLAPYSRLSIVAFVAVGIPDKTTRTPSINWLVINIRSTSHVKSGTTTSLMSVIG